MKFLLRWTLLAVLWLPLPAAAQFNEGVKLEGQVLIAQTLAPVEGVAVELLRRTMVQDRTYTGSRGEFEFVRLVVSEYVLRVRHPGYLPVERTINLNVDPGARHGVRLLLEPDPDADPPEAAAAPPLSARELRVPTSARDEFQAGLRELNQNNQPGKSIPFFEKAIALHQDFDEAYVQLALAHFLTGSRSNALRTLAKAVEVYPQNARAFALMGKVLIDANQPEPGIQALEEALAIDETLWGAHADLGAALLYKKQLDPALAHARRALELNDAAPMTHVLLASVLMERKEFAEAITVQDEILRRFPEGKLAAEVRKQRDLARKQLKQQSP